MVRARPPGGFAQARTDVDAAASDRRHAQGEREDSTSRTPIARGRPPGLKKTKAHR
ncbi:MAG: hypothetical protein LC624_03040 [Halobacteriales archaeon]|nr:hypothetical protein [Halobacteriales archaeon]